jgi:hypothetical protein
VIDAGSGIVPVRDREPRGGERGAPERRPPGAAAPPPAAEGDEPAPPPPGVGERVDVVA